MEVFLNNVGAWSWLAYSLIFVVVLIESAGAPIPGLTIAMAGGALAGQGRLDFWLVYLATVVGGTLGGNLGFELGRRGGRRLLERFGHLIGLTPPRLELGEGLFHRHGSKALVIGRYLPVLCFAGGLLSGITRLPYRRFFIYNLLSISLWATTHLGLAFFFGRSLDVLIEVFNKIGLAAVLGAALLGASVYLIRRLRRPRSVDLLKGSLGRQADK